MNSINLLIVTFDNETNAKNLLDEIDHATQEGTFDYIDAAVVVQHKDGRVEFNETVDPSTKRGAVVGGIIGGVIGLLGGPAGAGLGAAAGAAIAGYATNKMDLGIPDEDLRSIANSLKPESSAAVIIIKDIWRDTLFTILDKFDCEIKQQDLPQEVVTKLLDEPS